MGEPTPLETTSIIETDTPLAADSKTQILMHKNQGGRMDLFGFGAVLFDLITCGKSPEGFYDYLMAYDKPPSMDHTKEEISVGPLINQYDNLPPFAGSDSEYLGAFEAFIDETTDDRMPSEIVFLIFKCMLYRTSETLYAICHEDGAMAFKEIQSSIIALQS